MPAPPRLILASTSRYRSELLARLRLPFDVVAPGVDESPRPDAKALYASRRVGSRCSVPICARTVLSAYRSATGIAAIC